VEDEKIVENLVSVYLGNADAIGRIVLKINPIKME
jgi:hypothetical protein